MSLERRSASVADGAGACQVAQTGDIRGDVIVGHEFAFFVDCAVHGRAEGSGGYRADGLLLCQWNW